MELQLKHCIVSVLSATFPGFGSLRSTKHCHGSILWNFIGTIILIWSTLLFEIPLLHYNKMYPVHTYFLLNNPLVHLSPKRFLLNLLHASIFIYFSLTKSFGQLCRCWDIFFWGWLDYCPYFTRKVQKGNTLDAQGTQASQSKQKFKIGRVPQRKIKCIILTQ